MTMWNHWGRYHQSDGELGEEPPELIRNLQYWGGQLLTATDEAHRTKAAKTLLQAAADNLWASARWAPRRSPWRFRGVSRTWRRTASGARTTLDDGLPSGDLVHRRDTREAVAKSMSCRATS